jgi:hypothetical protein
MQMSRPIAVGLLFLTALLVTVAPVSAQNDCPHDLTQVRTLLATADAAWANGDNAAALEAVSQAQALLEQIQQECGEDVPAASGRPGADRIIILLKEHTTSFGIPELTKLAAAAYADGLKVTIFEDQAPFLADLKKPDVAAAIYGGQLASDPGLRELYDFVQDGGRILLMYDGSWIERNAALQGLFGVSLAAEKIDIQSHSSFHYKPSVLPAWLDQYSVGIPSLDNDLIAFFRVFLVVPSTWPGERGTAVGENANTRLLYYSNPTGTVIFWPLPLGGNYEFTPLFFSDENIDYFDNEIAALAVLEHLLGR